jgi:hypothetical protein
VLTLKVGAEAVANQGADQRAAKALRQRGWWRYGCHSTAARHQKPPDNNSGQSGEFLW